MNKSMNNSNSRLLIPMDSLFSMLLEQPETKKSFKLACFKVMRALTGHQLEDAITSLDGYDSFYDLGPHILERALERYEGVPVASPIVYLPCEQDPERPGFMIKEDGLSAEGEVVFHHRILDSNIPKGALYVTFVKQ